MKTRNGRLIKVNAPVYHELRFHPGQYHRVYWPIRKSNGGSEDKTILIQQGDRFKTPDGMITINKIHDGKNFSLVDYTQQNGLQKLNFSTSIGWFAYNIMDKKLK